MDEFSNYLDTKYKSTNLITDPIYGSIRFTTPFSDSNDERTERDLIDNKWLQRLRKIHQLQSAFWVFPSAENSRFLHSLGTMHLAGKFARSLYYDLRENFKTDCPSQNFIEETLRICGLLHDIGHGPFGHIFDESFLKHKFKGLNHEKIGSKIIKEELSFIIENIKRSPNGSFNSGEKIDPKHICYIIDKSAVYQESFPKWIKALKCLFCSKFFTVDNLDYVLRDSYFTGYSRDPLRIDRILFYTSLNTDGLVFASPGRNTFKQFMGLKIDLYNSVYFHRTVRSIDLAIDSIFYETMDKICYFNPLENLKDYFYITEWDLFNTCKEWVESDDFVEKELGNKWQKILLREKLWFVAFEKEFKINSSRDNESLFFSQFIDLKNIEENINNKLIAQFGQEELKDIVITVDTQTQDPRPLNLEYEESMKIFDNKTGSIEEKRVYEWLSDIPVRIIIFRVYTNNKKYINEIAEITNALMHKYDSPFSTNI
ncbi:MAG: HD domain-containing protein [Actinobacteria bacterium]|nr:HD domain-containing protein [Actinomycetota bacterium]MBM3713450.1 HD domain-containing protein [Actinomycetota bacterium]